MVLKLKNPATIECDWVYSLVTTEGFEPSTLGAEIRYSIQLNYVANYKRKYSSKFKLIPFFFRLKKMSLLKMHFSK